MYTKSFRIPYTEFARRARANWDDHTESIIDLITESQQFTNATHRTKLATNTKTGRHKYRGNSPHSLCKHKYLAFVYQNLTFHTNEYANVQTSINWSTNAGKPFPKQHSCN